MKKLLLMFAMLASVNFTFAEDKTSELVLNSDNTIILDDEVNDETVARVTHKAQQMDSKLKSGDPIYLVLYTPGGSIQAGLEMITMLKGLNRPVHTVTLFAASMGFQTVQGLGTRYITPFGTLMAHKARGQFSGEFPGQIDSRYVYYIKRLNELDRITVSRSGGKLTEKSFKELYADEVWIDGFDAKNYGLADQVVTIKCDASLNGTRDNILNFMGFSIKLVLSACPLIMGPLEIVPLMQTDQGLIPLNEFLAKGGSLTGAASDPYAFSSFSSASYGPAHKAAPVLTVQGLTMEKINAEVAKAKESREKSRLKVRSQQPSVSPLTQ
jgi:ATP-dependent Clp protease protease subunit